MVPLFPKQGDPVEHNERAAGDIDQPLEQIKLREVNGVRRAVKRALSRLVPAAAIGAIAGAMAGRAVENKYHDWTGFSHESPGEVRVVDESEEETAPEQDGRKSGLLAKTRGMLKDAKEAAKRTIRDAAEHTKVMQKYREVREELDRLWVLGDKLSFWVPFLMAFLAAALLANKLLESYDRLVEPVDPAVAANLRALESTANALLTRANALSRSAGDTSGEVRDLAEHARRLVPGLDDAMRQVKRKP